MSRPYIPGNKTVFFGATYQVGMVPCLFLCYTGSQGLFQTAPEGVWILMSEVKTFFYRTICGFFLGFSTFAPGFSGSVVAIAMGIYRDLVQIMSNPLVELRKQVRFLIPLLLGALLSLVLFVVIFRTLFELYRKPTMLLFVGLIAGNLPLIGKQLKKHTPLSWHFLVGGLLSFSIALGLGLAMGIGHIAGGEGGTVPFFWVAFGSFLAGAVAFIPGMSVSAILIVTGAFGEILLILESLLELRLTYLPQVFGIAVFAFLGLVLTARGIKRIFDRFPGFANACVLGFMSGTLVGIFVESLLLEDPNFNWALGIVVLAAGVGLSSLFVLLGKSIGKSPRE